MWQALLTNKYPAFLVGHSTQDVAVGTLLTRLLCLDKCSLARTFGTCHELERELNNSRTQLLAEIRLDLRGKRQSLAPTLLDSFYNFMMTLLIHTDAEISILPCQGFSEKNILSLLSDQPGNIFDELYQACILGREKLVSSTVDNTTTILWAVTQSHEVMEKFSKHKIKRHPSITSKFL